MASASTPTPTLQRLAQAAKRRATAQRKLKAAQALVRLLGQVERSRRPG